jgi:hypothetical protein
MHHISSSTLPVWGNWHQIASFRQHSNLTVSVGFQNFLDSTNCHSLNILPQIPLSLNPFLPLSYVLIQPGTLWPWFLSTLDRHCRVLDPSSLARRASFRMLRDSQKPIETRVSKYLNEKDQFSSELELLPHAFRNRGRAQAMPFVGDRSCRVVLTVAV